MIDKRLDWSTNVSNDQQTLQLSDKRFKWSTKYLSDRQHTRVIDKSLQWSTKLNLPTCGQVCIHQRYRGQFKNINRRRSLSHFYLLFLKLLDFQVPKGASSCTLFPTLATTFCSRETPCMYNSIVVTQQSEQIWWIFAH
jgi:hypothetical protein